MSEQPFKNSRTNQADYLRNLIRILFKRKQIILVFFSTIVGLSILFNLIVPSSFQSSAKIVVMREVDTEKAMLLNMNYHRSSDDYAWINSEVETIKSYPVALRVLEKTNSDFNIESGEFTSNEETSKAVRIFQKKLGVQTGRNSNIIEISFKDKDPRIAQQTVKNIISAYMAYRLEVYADTETYRFLEEQMNVADVKLRDLEKQQADFKEDQEMISPQAQREIMIAKLSEYEKNLTAVKTRRFGKEAKLKVIEEQLENGETTNIPSTESSDSPSREKYIANLKSELLTLEIESEQLLSKYKPESKEIKTINTQIASTKNKITKEIQQIITLEKTSINALRAEESVLRYTIKKINSQLRNFAQKEYQLDQLSRGIEDNREIYSMLLKQKEEARLSLAKEERGVKVKVISPAIVPLDPVAPRRKLNVIISTMFAGFLALSFALAREYFDNSIDSPEKLESYIGLTCLGSVREMDVKN